MYVLLILLLLLIVFWILAVYKEETFFILVFISGFSIFIMLMVLWGNNVNVDYHINQRLVKKEMYEECLRNPTKEAERVAFLPEIIEYNQEILSDKYWNDTQWDWWINDKYTKMELIK